MLLVGSSAAHKHHPYIWHKPRDVDWISTYDRFQDWSSNIEKRHGAKTTLIGKDKFVSLVDGMIHEVEIAWPGTAGHELLERYDAFEQPRVASMNDMFALKASHRYRKNCPHFEKTLRDYHTMKALGCRIEDQEWLKQRERETYTAKRPSLNASKQEFFGADQNQYKYDHDTLHLAVAHLGKPAYEFYKGDSAEVMCSKKKWDACPDMIKRYGVLEEAYVLALERSQIPFEGRISPFESFRIALMKVCTSITSGWFREYAYDNYYKVMDLYNDNYVCMFKHGLLDGTVKEAA